MAGFGVTVDLARAVRDALRYTVDKDLLGKVMSVDEAKADVFVLPLQSTRLKYAFGDGENVRQPGDVGIEAYFGDQWTIKVPVGQDLQSTFGIRSRGRDKIAGSDARRIAAMAAAGYKGSGNFGGGWGVLRSGPATRP